MNIKEFKDVIKTLNECHVEDDSTIESCWKKEIEILCEDVPSTIEYLKHDCTADEYSWISEVIDNIAETTQNRELIECYKSLTTKFKDECKKYNIMGSIECAEIALNKHHDQEI